MHTGHTEHCWQLIVWIIQCNEDTESQGHLESVVLLCSCNFMEMTSCEGEETRKGMSYGTPATRGEGTHKNKQTKKRITSLLS